MQSIRRASGLPSAAIGLKQLRNLSLRVHGSVRRNCSLPGVQPDQPTMGGLQRRLCRKASERHIEDRKEHSAMAARIDYEKVAPEAIQAMRKVEEYVRGSGLERSLLELVR